MLLKHYKSKLALLLSLSLSINAPAFAAKPIALRQQPLTILKQFGFASSGIPTVQSPLQLQELSRHVDFNHRLHLRLQETYQKYPIWGADVVVHLPQISETEAHQPLASLLASARQGSMNGMLYQELASDLQAAPAYIFLPAQAEKALAEAISHYERQAGRGQGLTDKETHLQIYLDKNKKAHWIYYVQFKASRAHRLPAKPTYLMDAQSFEIYQLWDNIQTANEATKPPKESRGGGFGGNKKMGKLVYDGLANHQPALTIQRAVKYQTCYLKNKEVVVKDASQEDVIEQYTCHLPDATHNDLFWNGEEDAANGGYSPGNDALFSGKVITNLYRQWYGVPVLTKYGKPMKLVMRVHEQMDNAYWDGETMTFGDGIELFYPLVSLGVSAHEISHGFTQQHANLIYDGQSGGLNESFSDMAAQAAEFYLNGHSSWQIGGEVMKGEDQVLRDMEHPSKDCAWLDRKEGCSIEHLRDYHEKLNVHFSSGIFNRAFYLLATAPEWDTKKAFDVMVKANMDYWTAMTSFEEAACDVMQATSDYQYPKEAVVAAFDAVGIEVRRC